MLSFSLLALPLQLLLPWFVIALIMVLLMHHMLAAVSAQGGCSVQCDGTFVPGQHTKKSDICFHLQGTLREVTPGRVGRQLD